MTIRRRGDLTFNPKTHVYKKDGIQFPSVTQVLEIIDKNKEFYTPGSSNRGTKVHEITADYDRKKKVNVPMNLLGYLDAWKKFLFEYNLGKAEIIEKFYYSVYGFFGTLDRAWIRRQIIADIKTGIPSSKDFFQLEAYHKMIKEIKKYSDIDFTLMLVYLKPDGSYKEEIFEPESKRWTDFLCIKRAFDIREGRI